MQLRRGESGQAAEGTGQQRGQDSGKRDTNDFLENKQFLQEDQWALRAGLQAVLVTPREATVNKE